MYATDFEYDGEYLSDFGFIVCQFDGSYGTNITSAGSITFNTVSMLNGKYHPITSTSYDACLTSTFDICKNPDVNDDMIISQEEYRWLMRWLNRREFLRFSICDEEPNTDKVYYNVSFNVEKIKIGERLCGLRLTLTTDKPFGYGELISEDIFVQTGLAPVTIIDQSDEIGMTYVNAIIDSNTNGAITIHNSMNDKTVEILGCFPDEVITINGMLKTIETNRSDHDILNDFNYVFPAIGNTYDSRENVLSFTAPCRITYEYYPIIKESI